MRKLLLTVCFLALLTNFALAQCGSAFYDGFESGSYTPTWTIGTGLTSGAVTTTNPYSGLYRLEGVGGTSSHLTGFNTTIPAATPTTISWDIFPTGTGASNYMVLGNSSISATNCIAFCYWQGGTNIRFVSSSTAIFNCTPGAWYHIEMRNINWTSHTFDIYINNTLVQASFPFRSATQNNVSRIGLYNFNTATGVWDNINIGGAPGPANTSVVTEPLCNGGADGVIDLSVTGGNPGYSYLWSTGATTQDISALTAGTYTVTVTDQTPCTTSTSITVTEPTMVVVAPSATDLTCFNSGDGTAMATPTGGTAGYSYTWSNGDTAQSIGNLNAGIHFVTVTDAHGCTATDSITTTQPTEIVIADSLSLPSCFGDSNGTAVAIPSGGAGSYSYLWSTGDTLANTGLISAGTYTVLVTDSSGCTQTDTILMTEPSPLVVTSLTTNPGCLGDSTVAIDLVVTGGTPAYSYAWNNGDTIEDRTGLNASVFIVLVSDANGCAGADTIILVNPTAISASGLLTGDNGTTNGAIDLTVVGGTPSYSYLWSNGATTEDLGGLSAGTYSVTITDNNGCTSTQTFTVDLVIGVQNPEALGFSAHPNPFQNGFTVAFHQSLDEPVELSVTDLHGRVLWTKKSVSETNVQVELDLPIGVYFLTAQQGISLTTIKLMRQ